MKLKICGMKYNIAEVAALQPDYMGFIFYEKSPRHYKGIIPALPKGIKKVGVFVDEDESLIKRKNEEYNFDFIQLHGQESPEFCNSIKSIGKQIIKVFSIKNEFDFSVLKDYEAVCDYFLFDTKGKHPGGNGYTFNWKVLDKYPSTKPYFLSGGIGLNEADAILSFLRKQESKYCHAIDVNSKFEDKPGLKNIEELKAFKELTCHVERS
ncbi:N-(5'-phosphoribosyl)anthranilate isomerase [Hanstruepera neustonica]|uniref:N-(5'-phosphoribosyl)anthranilate isomerase n=1 Tax=Hanstruepera neustonica TaxID=1445657 RepID=A0A2K1E0G3_9FLAO|nr:phosphoribosylanthranilate isomerase [Hanstruepera neustonica]PNQ73776.1 N-(5'-phosphoribosyl)anthranilate isomerase [Hanstruepera neustonica]